MKPNDDEEPLAVSIPRMSKLVGDVAPSSIRRWIANGLIGSITIGRRRLIPMSEVRRLVTQKPKPASTGSDAA